MKITLIVMFIALAAIAGTLSGCSTVWGVGKDISSAAEWTHDKITEPSKKDPVKQDPAK